MHQGSLKSAVRRSLSRSLLLPSDDDNETIQTKANGKAKVTAVGSISARAHQGRDPTPAKGKEEEEKALAYRNSSDFQLMQVSREAHKLTQMIDSWSMARHVQGSSEFFAEDLLRGAIGLQESLDMLKKLQDVSKKMPQVSNKQKQNIVDKRYEKMSPQEFGYEGFRVGDYQRRICEPRVSSDDFSRSCIEELKQVIKESLHKQNIMFDDDDKNSSSRSMQYSAISNLEDKYLRQNMEPLNSSGQPKKARSSNLVAKLMGLEETPLKTIQPAKKKEKNFVSPPRPRFDIEMPKARKSHFLVQNNEQQDNRLDNLIETMHFKGLVKRSHIEEKGLEPTFFSTEELEQCGRNLQRVDQLPPIVIMKPLHWHGRDNNVQNETLANALMQDKIQEIKLVKENNRPDYHKHILAEKQEPKEWKHMERHVAKTLPYYVDNKQQRKKVIITQKLNNKETKPARLNMKQQEDKGVQATRNKVLNPKTSMVQPKHNGEPQHQDPKSHYRTIAKAITNSSKDTAKSGVKATRRAAIAISANEDTKCNESDTAIKHCIKVNDILKAVCGSNGSILVEQMNKEKKSSNSAADNLNKDPEIFAEAIPKTNQDIQISKLKEIVELPDCKKVGVESTVGDELKSVLLSSHSFLSCVKKLFGVDASRSINYQKESASMDRKIHSKLYLDVSEELMARKYLQLKNTFHPLMQAQSWGRIIYFSIDKLVEEINKEISKLASYSELQSIDACEGSLYISLERELMSKDTIINSVWDIGWDCWICFEEADQVVDEVSKQIFSRLIEEAALELTQDCTL
ncbi:uncharacterized protein LOC122045714 [Zingiber officinale]|uniref:DUF3741 domain-containing protein n=1 Tax=Zingiber officinale TaxID=94328 RepID=A0A8J5HP75_ZINOF|nr:uncharacterized protein LOC122045714 [Zingiber officinale]KAG6524094.1 hypothetical protein ZIOFF_013984 [Zingiber officinale]